MLKFERRTRRGRPDGSNQRIGHLLQVDGIYLARLLSVVPAKGTACDFEEPGSKQHAVSKLIHFAVDDQHDILGQVLAQRRLAATRPKKGDQLRSEDFKHRGERILVRRFQEVLRGCALLKESLTCDCLVHAPRKGTCVSTKPKSKSSVFSKSCRPGARVRPMTALVNF